MDTFKEETKSILHKLLQKWEEEKLLPNSFSDLKTYKNIIRKLWAIFLRTLTQKSQQTFRKLNQVNIKMIIHHNQVRFISGTQAHFNIWKSTNVIHHINRPYKKNHMIISIAAKKIIQQNSTPISDLKWNETNIQKLSANKWGISTAKEVFS